jgi:hypothetical protein
VGTSKWTIAGIRHSRTLFWLIDNNFIQTKDETGLITTFRIKRESSVHSRANKDLAVSNINAINNKD